MVDAYNDLVIIFAYQCLPQVPTSQMAQMRVTEDVATTYVLSVIRRLFSHSECVI